MENSTEINTENIGTQSPVMNDVTIKPNPLGTEGKKPVIVNGIDITYLPVAELTEEIADLMTDEQAEEYTKGFNEEEMEAFRDVYGIVITAPLMSEDELKERSEKRTALTNSLANNQPQEDVVEQPVPEEKKEQTGNVIFGVRN